MIVISDTSSISNLIQIGRLDLLHQLFGQIIITTSVFEELSVIEIQRQALHEISWIEIKTPHNQTLVNSLLKDLDIGEAESIVLAIELGAKHLIIDEFKGRIVAENLGINIVGVLGILIMAKNNGLIPVVKPIIEDLLQVGFRLNQQLIATVLYKLDET